jgi:hypothetical protein
MSSAITRKAVKANTAVIANFARSLAAAIASVGK